MLFNKLLFVLTVLSLCSCKYIKDIKNKNKEDKNTHAQNSSEDIEKDLKKEYQQFEQQKTVFMLHPDTDIEKLKQQFSSPISNYDIEQIDNLDPDTEVFTILDQDVDSENSEG